jgi:putative heme iron utilization protein
MRSEDRPPANDVADRAVRLIDEADALALATIDQHGRPSASYLPFARIGDRLCALVSGLAAHTRDLASRPSVSLLFLDPNASGEAYARPRMTVTATTAFVERGSADGDAICSAIEARLGETVRVLCDLPDFVPLFFTLGAARVVLGFGSAHNIDGETLCAALRAAHERFD